jgi:uncharacterized protein (TIGR02145 family)
MTKNILSRFARCFSLAAVVFFACAELPEDCGNHFINSKTQFCLNDQAYERCGGKEFSPYREFCHDNVVFSKCNGVAYTPPNNPCGEPEQSSSSVAPRDVPSSSSAVQSSMSQGQSSSSSAPGSSSQGQSSSSSIPGSSSQEQSSSSSVPGSSSLGQSSSSSTTSSSSQGQSSSVIPNPIATGEIAFKNFDYGFGGNYFYIGTNVTIEDNIASTVAVSNADDAGCGDVKIELSGCGAPGAVTTSNANCTITAKAVVTCIQKHELKTATATVVPNPSLNGSCAWVGGKLFSGGTTANVTAEPALQNVYGRDCEGPYFLVGGERKSDVYAGLMVDESGIISTMSGITIGATCASKAVTAITCPNIAIDPLYDDRDQQTYKIVLIGTQVWMAENLNFNATDSKCYSNSTANCEKYGRLYNWSTAMKNSASSNKNPSEVQGICPSGWHLPSDAEWTALTNYVGTNAGTKLKANSALWNSNGKGTDDFGFSALPGGLGYSSGSFNNVGYLGDWWSATESTASGAYGRGMSYGSANVFRDDGNRSGLYSVRCVQD